MHEKKNNQKNPITYTHDMLTKQTTWNFHFITTYTPEEFSSMLQSWPASAPSSTRSLEAASSSRQGPG